MRASEGEPVSSILAAAIAVEGVLLIANLLIVAHELGHYAAGRALGISAPVRRQGRDSRLALISRFEK
jgi:hypothetical protein